jgi:hypothetical protein
MRPHKTRKPFTLYQKETQADPVWYARFWNESARRYEAAVAPKGSPGPLMGRY